MSRRSLLVPLALLWLTNCSSANFDVVEGPIGSGHETSPDASEEASLPSDSAPLLVDAGVDGEVETNSNDSVAPDAGAIDTGSAPVDSGSDTGSTPVDTGSTPVDTGSTPVDIGVDAPSTCAAITMGCVTSPSTGTSCDKATGVGRATASATGGYVATGVVMSASFTDGEAGCASLGPDRAYRLFVHKGERIDTSVTSKTAGVVLQTMFWESGCDGAVCTGGTNFSCGTAGASGSPIYNTYVAKGDGWVSIVIGARAAVSSVTFDIQVALTACKEAGCGC